MKKNSLPPSKTRLFSPMAPLDDLTAMSMVERNMYDGMSQGVQALRAEPSSALAAAYRNHLEILDATTAASFAGLAGEDPYVRSREKWRIAIAQTDRPSRELIDLQFLGLRRGYVQFEVRLDEPIRLVARAAYLNDVNELTTTTVEFGGSLSASWGLEQQAVALADGLSELRHVLADGISKLVVCPAPAAYNLPYHEALLRLGFEEVSYTHRISSLEPRIRSNLGDVAVVGFAGKGSRHIAAVDTELEVISRMYSTSRLQQLTTIGRRTVHLAGHGHAGTRTYETAMEVSANGSPLSSARVLLDFDASASDLVFLSACSSGAGTYLPDQLAEAIPMDVAFVEAGAAAVVSTSAPVNDYVACLFAVVFHAETLAGATKWEAFVEAREAGRTGTSPRADLIEDLWPTWETDVSAAILRHPHDWLSYRLSGRYWV